ncbi:MAG: dihydrolipoyl dehydrogenase [Candidatus Omnitrophota bacterium]
MKKYQTIVIGSGPGGYVAAIRLAQLGKSVAIVERFQDHVGGVCLNEGCIPTKALINSAKFFDSAKEAEISAVELKAGIPDMAKMVSAALNTSAQLRNGIKYLFKKNNIDLIVGNARIASKNSLIVTNNGKDDEFLADNFIIATGSRPKVLASLEADEKNVLTSDGVFKLKQTPKALLIIGGGAIGVEFGSLFNSFGSNVTIVELEEQLLPLEDKEIAIEMTKYLKKRGIEIFTKSQVLELQRKPNSRIAKIKTNNETIEKEFEYVLVCVGRSPNTENLGLEKIGLTLEKGFIKVNEKMQTSVDNIYAIGDCINSPMLAHVASVEGILAAEIIAGLKSEPIDYSSIPSVVYSQFEAASVGLTEELAREKGLDVVICKHFFKSCPKALLLHKDDGFVKIIADKKTFKIIGVHIAGIGASELIHEFVLAKANNLRLQDIAKTTHAHPSLSEIVVDAAKSVFDKPIHG